MKVARADHVTAKVYRGESLLMNVFFVVALFRFLHWGMVAVSDASVAGNEGVASGQDWLWGRDPSTETSRSPASERIQQEPGTSEDATGIEVIATFFKAQFMLFSTRPTVSLDDVEFPARWGRNFIAATPGKHRVSVFFGYMGDPRTAENSIEVNVVQGGVTRVRFRPKMLASSPGRIWLARHQ